MLVKIFISIQIKKNPVKLWVNDFNQNGNMDKILTYTIRWKRYAGFFKT